MASSLSIPSKGERKNLTEEEYLRHLASEFGCYCIYKLGQGSTWSHYKPIDFPEEERQISGSSWTYAVKVYDHGKVMNIDGKWESSPLRKNKKWYEVWR